MAVQTSSPGAEITDTDWPVQHFDLHRNRNIVHICEGLHVDSIYMKFGLDVY